MAELDWSLRVMGIVFDTFERLGCLLFLLGIVFDTLERLGCLLLLLGIVFDTYVGVRLVTACDRYRFRYPRMDWRADI